MSDEDALRELQEFVGTGGWRRLSGFKDKQILIHVWPDDSVDTLSFSGESEALAERTNAAGDPVWAAKGTVAEVISALRDVPPPSHPAAPRFVIHRDAIDRNL